VREMQARLTGKRASEPTDESLDATMIRDVSAAELLMVDASRMLVEYLCGTRASDELLVTALLGEAETSLLSIDGATISDVVLPHLDRAKVEGALAALREARSPLPPPHVIEIEEHEPAPTPKSTAALDRAIMKHCRELARRNLRIGRLAQKIFAARAWRALGFETAEQYARERVGMSLSSLEHRATLARRVHRHPALGEALERGEIGYESALLIGRLLGWSASSALVTAWIERARVRTYKHLREDVGAVQMAVNLDPTVSREPPGAADLEAIAELERRVQSGDFFRSHGTTLPQTSVTLLCRDPSIRPLRLRVPIELHEHWQKIESCFRSTADPRASFVAFLCFSLWSTWLPFLRAWDDKWIDVYRRDRHRCASPVCHRRDVTPHHIVFQRHGGGDESSNLLSVCAWCHLHGIHRGRLSAHGRASEVRWNIGRQPIMSVHQREVVELRAPEWSAA
jgi:hypothetical protein